MKMPDLLRFLEPHGPKQDPNSVFPPAGSYYVLMVQSRVNGLYRAATGVNEQEMKKAQKRYCDFLGAGDIEHVHLYDPEGNVMDNPPSILSNTRYTK